MDGVYVAVTAKGVFFINPPAITPIWIETRVIFSAPADLADALFQDGHSETFLHPNLEPLCPDIVRICKVPGGSFL